MWPPSATGLTGPLNRRRPSSAWAVPGAAVTSPRESAAAASATVRRRRRTRRRRTAQTLTARPAPWGAGRPGRPSAVGAETRQRGDQRFSSAHTTCCSCDTMLKEDQVNKRELVGAVAAHTETDAKSAQKIVDGTIDVILATVAKGEVVNLSGFAKFERKSRPA